MQPYRSSQKRVPYNWKEIMRKRFPSCILHGKTVEIYVCRRFTPSTFLTRFKPSLDVLVSSHKVSSVLQVQSTLRAESKIEEIFLGLTTGHSYRLERNCTYFLHWNPRQVIIVNKIIKIRKRSCHMLKLRNFSMKRIIIEACAKGHWLQ